MCKGSRIRWRGGRECVMLGHIFFFGFAFPLPSSLPELLPSDLNRWVCICKLSWRPLLTYFPLSLTGYLPSVIYVGYRNGGVRDEYRHTPKQWGGLTGSSGKLFGASALLAEHISRRWALLWWPESLLCCKGWADILLNRAAIKLLMASSKPGWINQAFRAWPIFFFQ